MTTEHQHGPATHDRAFAAGVALNIAFVVTETVFGVLAGSLALLADAAHNFSDVISLLLAWGASYLSRRARSERRTYGWRSSSILAALVNAVVLLVVTGGIAWEAVQRFSAPAHVVGGTVAWVALAGVGINTATALLFMRGRSSDLNIRGAFLHMAADAAVSAGVVVAGVAMLWTRWPWIDPLVTLLITVVILASTSGLLRESINLVLHAVPEAIDPQAVHAYLESLPGVTAVHDLHIWAMSTTETAEHTTMQWERAAEGGCVGRSCDSSPAVPRTS